MRWEGRSCNKFPVEGLDRGSFVYGTEGSVLLDGNSYTFYDANKKVVKQKKANEVADATWSEIDFRNGVWIVPGARMKSATDHVVPITADIAAILKSLPRWTRGDFAFTSREGQLPVNGFSKPKQRLDRLSGVKDWVLHDLRRTARSHCLKRSSGTLCRAFHGVGMF